MKNYLDLLKNIYENDHDHPDRTKVGRRSLFGTSLRFNLQEGFPLVTTRYIRAENFIKEIIWFIRGSCNNLELTEEGVNIWNNWAVKESSIDDFIKKHVTEKPDLENKEHLEKELKSYLTERFLNSVGPIYGPAWRMAPSTTNACVFNPEPKGIEEFASDVQELIRDVIEKEKGKTTETGEEITETMILNSFKYRCVDQLNNVINSLKNNPHSARHVISNWIPEWQPFEDLTPEENVLLGRGALSPCPILQQYHVMENLDGQKFLLLQVYCRSVDLPIGWTSNIAQYALLLSLIAHCTGMIPHELIMVGGDTHIYLNQLPLIEEQLSREPLPLPKIVINSKLKDIFQVTYEDITIEGYNFHPAIKYPLAK